ncbi:sulfurtransferase TusA family protein [Roseococcus thiosulfatophilus]|uniref:sulfurtransferase TusA family protein n=1 Tax=Roseococcus thiosulfatophilus TaxID=35813 RepID=UPI001A8D8CD1|nr:sulfurtransferase TusA family protein [Roseococcus thiosulfatophilus]
MASNDGQKNADLAEIHESLDVTADRCPMTFVRTRLRLDRMAAGQVLEVRFAGREPAENLPRSARELGHDVLALDIDESEAFRGRMVVRKN